MPPPLPNPLPLLAMFIPRITTQTSELNNALLDTFRLASKDPVRSLQKAMRYIAIFAVSKIAKADPQKIDTYFRQVVNAYAPGASSRIRITKSKKTGIRTTQRTPDQWQGTRAVVLAYATNYKNIRSIKNRDQAYRLVQKFVNAHKFSAGFHRWAFITILKNLKGRTPDLSRTSRPIVDTRQPLSEFHLDETWQADTLSGSMADLADNEEPVGARPSILKIAPDAFTQAEREYAALLQQWLAKDLAASAQRANLITTTSA